MHCLEAGPTINREANSLEAPRLAGSSIPGRVGSVPGTGSTHNRFLPGRPGEDKEVVFGLEAARHE